MGWPSGPVVTTLVTLPKDAEETCGPAPPAVVVIPLSCGSSIWDESGCELGVDEGGGGISCGGPIFCGGGGPMPG